jgi:glycosyltransferase involved in cell wall biosynthesis
MSEPWLSVVMPTYNAMDYLESALDSLVAQEGDDFEVVAVDDGSTDATRETLEAYTSRLPMRVVEREHRGNWPATANVGFSLAKGRYLSILHHDDTWCPSRIVHLKEWTSKWPEASLVLHPSWFIDAAGRRVGLLRCPLPRRKQCLQPREVLEHLLVQNFIAPPAPVFKRAAAMRVGNLDERLWHTPDWDLWLKLAGAGPTIFRPLPLTCYRVHPGSMTSVRTWRLDEVRRDYQTVTSRYLDAERLGAGRLRRVGPVARFSLELNLALIRVVTRRRVGWLRLAWGFLRLGPAGWRRLLRDSRVIERSVSRIRAGLLKAGRSQGPPRSRSESPSAAGAAEGSGGRLLEKR